MSFIQSESSPSLAKQLKIVHPSYGCFQLRTQVKASLLGTNLEWMFIFGQDTVNKNLALLFLLLNLGGVAVQCSSALYLFAALLLTSGADYLKVFQADQLQALAMLFLYLRQNGFMIAQIFFGAWLFPLGYLVFKSGFLPRILGIVLMIHSVFWLMTFLQSFLLPGFSAITYVSYPLGLIAELSLTLWLLIVGAKDQSPALADGQN